MNYFLNYFRRFRDLQFSGEVVPDRMTIYIQWKYLRENYFMFCDKNILMMSL